MIMTMTDRKHTGWLIGALAVTNILLIAAGAWLYTESRSKIGFVQTAYLLSNYQGFVDASVSYQQKSAIWQSNVDTLRREVETMKSDFETQRPTLTAREKALTEELIRTREQQLTQYRQGVQQQAAREDQEITGRVVQEINAFLREYGEKNAYKIIFGATEVGNIVYAEEAIDLTEEVLEALNRRYRGE
jgi:outer membrane protein